jgi:UDP-N-acetylglucosamine diphosphorylase/glucosamine-1-phosphate N-acetyltransferase
MSSHICLFEDIYHPNLLPLVYFRPTFNLRCGILSLKEKVQYAYPKAEVSLHCRTYLADYMRLRNPGHAVNDIAANECLFINGRAVVDEKFIKQVPAAGVSDIVYVKDDVVVAARVSGQKLKTLNGIFSISDFDGLHVQQVDVDIIAYPWELIKYNGAQLRSDFAALKRASGKRRAALRKFPGVHILNPSEVTIGTGTVIRPGVVIDAENGPVYIGKNVQIMSFSTIIGPAYIGDKTIVKVGAKIYADCSIGPVCKVGGELESTIMHSYSNKQHDGFLGHSYLGAWVNCGAGTVTSDLKNNYSSVKVYVNGEPVDSGMQFVGVTIGDHSKTAINSTFNTGTVIGVSSNVFGTGFPPRYVPSFSWGAAGETFTTYNIEKAIGVAAKMMVRRDIELSGQEEKLFRKIFDLTSDERKKRGMPV